MTVIFKEPYNLHQPTLTSILQRHNNNFTPTVPTNTQGGKQKHSQNIEILLAKKYGRSRNGNRFQNTDEVKWWEYWVLNQDYHRQLQDMNREV
jgi:hypothetical protein